VFRNALREALQEMSYWEFRTVTGYSVEEAQQVLLRLNEFLGEASLSGDSEAFMVAWLGKITGDERRRALALLSAEIAGRARERLCVPHRTRSYNLPNSLRNEAEHDMFNRSQAFGLAGIWAMGLGRSLPHETPDDALTEWRYSREFSECRNWQDFPCSKNRALVRSTFVYKEESRRKTSGRGIHR
jgi:hypothetical protein